MLQLQNYKTVGINSETIRLAVSHFGYVIKDFLQLHMNTKVLANSIKKKHVILKRMISHEPNSGEIRAERFRVSLQIQRGRE